MRKVPIFSQKWRLSSLLALLAIFAMLVQADVSFADPPPEGDQPSFMASTYTSTDGNTTIRMQEGLLDQAYFGANGTANGVAVTAAGLSLAPGQSNGTYVSAIIRSPLNFTTDIVPLWKAELPQETELVLETRLSLNGGPWSDWVGNPEAFYPVRDDQHGGNLIWVDSAQAALQFRVILHSSPAGAAPTLNSLTLVFNNTSTGPTDAAIAGQIATMDHTTTTCPINRPTVVSRTAWGCPDGQASPRRAPTYAPVTHIIMHHTATSNNPYQDWARVVRTVWHYHANVLWWGDVGYNYLIDPKGIVYEGRAGGDDVIGVHDKHNRGSMAIGFIGCYGNCGYLGLSNAQPSTAMLNSAIDLMAWKLNQKGIDPHSTATYDGLYNIPVIAGGRDVTWTASPGDNLYWQLPYLRDSVKKEIEACQTSTETCKITNIQFDKNQYTIGEPINFTVKLADSQNRPLGGAKVTADVEKPVVTTNFAAAALDLIDRTGDYDGTFVNTDLAGTYRFKISASPIAGNTQFATCSAEKTAFVVASTKTYDLTVNTVGSGSVSRNPASGPYEENTVVTLTATPNTGWTFSGWSGDLSGTTNPATITMNGNKNVTATFTEVSSSHTLTVNVVGSGSVSRNPASGPYQKNTVVTLTATPDTGWIFSGWSGDLSGTTNPATITMTEDKTVTATFTNAPVRILTVDVVGEGSVSLNPAGGSYEENTVVTLTATPATGWTFSSWSGDLSGTTNPTTVTMTEDKDVTATFIPQGVLVKVEPALLEVSDCNAEQETLINVKNISNLTAAALEISYDPQVMELIDADPHFEGIQVLAGTAFSGRDHHLQPHQVDTSQGLISFDASILGGTSITAADANLVIIRWRPKSSGTVNITLDEVDLIEVVDGNSRTIDHKRENGSVIVSCGAFSGVAVLQGRQDHSGIVVTNAAGEQVTTNADGFFNVADASSLTINYPGYLAAATTAQVSSAANATSLGEITLLGGDLNQDNKIDIFDLAFVANHFDSNDSVADINGDGTVNILDLALVAGNYRQQGPLTNWQ